jgi:phosphoenolpyruvate-protein phosphotransferase/dihydroxyacetone kinase phosphotransfer subunit
MVALVLVSHSRRLAEAARELILQMTGPDFPVVVASGVGDNFDELGTDAVHISDVLQKLSRPEGILVLMDLGSAVLSAQTALELLGSNTTPIRLCSAPFVEGAVAAAVSAHAGCTLAEVAREAERGLAAKQQQVGEAIPQRQAPEPQSTTAAPGVNAELVLTIENAHGLHARPAAALVRTASRFTSDIAISNLASGTGPVTARSLTSLALLQVRKGDRILVACTGGDRDAALQAIRELADAGFGEPLEAPAAIAPVPVPSKRNTASQTQGFPGSDGIAIGPLAFLPMEELPPDDEPIGEPAAELAKLTAAMRLAGDELLQASTQPSAGTTGGNAILQAQALVLADPILIGKLQSLLESRHISAPRAWAEVTGDLASQYRAMGDPYMRERATDVLDIARRVLRRMTSGEVQGPIQLAQPSILMVEELLPSEAVACEPATVLGVIAAKGSATSHSAIILRTLGIPMVVGATSIGEGDIGKLAAMDGSTGEFWIDPDSQTIARLEIAKQVETQRKSVVSAAADQPSITLDGVRMEILAIVGNSNDAAVAAQSGAEGIGLLRTEFLFASRRDAPSEDEQVRALREIYVPISGPIIVRTLDVGADKPLAFLPQNAERNPYLGVRGIRLSLHSSELFLTHLRAILRSGEGHNIWLMFPMISQLNEVEQALQLLEQAHNELEVNAVPHLWPLKRGIMIEVPSAALLSEQFAQDLDFFSIGTNDLTQYTMAAERGNASVAELQDALSPAVLRLMHLLVDGASRHNRHVSVCGDAASDPLAAAIFAGLGVHSLSVRPKQVAEIKALFRDLRLSELKEIAGQALQCHEACGVRSLIRTYLQTANLSPTVDARQRLTE